MADDDKVSVELIAKIDQLVSGLNEARAQITGTTEGIASDVHEMAESVKKEEGLMHEVLSGALWLEFREFAREATEGVKQALESTAGAAQEFGLSTAKLAAIMQISQPDAAGLAAALHGVGESSETYEGIALRLQQRLQAGTGINKELADSLKGPNGEALTGVALMDRLREVLSQYSAEGQNAAVVQLGLGRRAADLYNILRIGSEDIEHQKSLYQSMGVDISGTGESAAKMEEVVNDLHTEFQAVGLVIGQAVMPVFTSFGQWLAGDGRAFIDGFVVALKGMVTVAYAIEQAFIAMGGLVSVVVTELFDSLKGLGTIIGDALSGNWSAIGGDVKASWNEMKEDASATWAAMSDSGQGFLDTMDRLWGKVEEKNEKNPFALPTGNKVAPVAPKGGQRGGQKVDTAAEEDIANDEKVSLEKIAIEERTDQHLFAMGQESAAQLLAQQVALENQTFAVKQATLEKELSVNGKSQADKEKILDQMQQLQVQHEGKLVEIQQKGEEQRAQAQQKGLGDYIRDQNERLSEGRAAIERQYEGDTLGALKRDQLEMQLTETIKGEELRRLDAELATLEQGTPAYDRVYKQREQVVKSFNKQTEQDQKKMVTDAEKDFQTFTGSMTSGFNSAIGQMITAHKSFSEAFKNFGSSMLNDFVQMLLKMVEQWVQTQAAKMIATNTAQAETAATQVPALAAMAAEGAYAATAAIPYVGPVLAPAAAASAEAAALALGAPAFAAGGMMVDRDQLVFTHKNEMILPAHISQGLQGLIGAGGGGGGTVNYSPTIHAYSQPNLKELLATGHRDFMDFLAARQRDGSLRRITG